MLKSAPSFTTVSSPLLARHLAVDTVFTQCSIETELLFCLDQIIASYMTHTHTHQSDRHLFISDSLFLLRFLRAAKFSQLKARTLLENYLKSFMSNKDWTNNIDMSDPKLQAFMRTGLVFYVI